jgi:hypothetical protein
MIFNALRAKWFDAGSSRTKVGEWLTLMLKASLFNLLRRHLGRVQD